MPRRTVLLRSVLGLESVDAGDGWLVFALPPTEVAVHPGKEVRHELYLMCHDLDETLSELKAKGVAVGAISEQRWAPARVDHPAGRR